MHDFLEFKRVWGVDGMPADKMRLAREAFVAGMRAAKKISEKNSRGCLCSEYISEIISEI